MFLTNNQADKMNFLSGLIVIYNRMNNSHTSISGREDRSKTIPDDLSARIPAIRIYCYGREDKLRCACLQY